MRLIASILSVVSVLATLLGGAHAQDADYELDPPENTLKSHRFVTPTVVPTPFVSTTVEFTQGAFRFGVTDFPLTRRRHYDVSAFGVTEQLKIGVRFLDLMQAFVEVQAELLTGANVRSIVLAGTSYNYRVGGGLLARVYRSGQTGTQVSLRAALATGPLGQIDLLAFANDIIDRDAAVVEDLFDLQIVRSALASGTETVFSAHAVLAQTLSRNFGLQASAGLTGRWESLTIFNREEERDVESDAHAFSPDVGVSLDATLLPAIQLGFNLEYVLRAQRRGHSDSEAASDTQLLHVVAAGVHVLDSRFQVGLSLGTLLGLDPIERTTVLRGEPLSSDTPTNFFAHFAMAYLW